MMFTEGREREDLIVYVQDKIYYLYDKGFYFFYFYIQVDVCISLVVIFESKKFEKDLYVNIFMNDIVIYLRCIKFFILLKVGFK